MGGGERERELRGLKRLRAREREKERCEEKEGIRIEKKLYEKWGSCIVIVRERIAI